MQHRATSPELNFKDEEEFQNLQNKYVYPSKQASKRLDFRNELIPGFGLVFDGAAERQKKNPPNPSPLSIPFHHQNCNFSFLLFSLLFLITITVPFLDIFRLSVPLRFGLDLLFFFFWFQNASSAYVALSHSFYFKTKAATSQSFPIRFFFFNI